MDRVKQSNLFFSFVGTANVLGGKKKKETIVLSGPIDLSYRKSHELK